jgi:hypothetical protein
MVGKGRAFSVRPRTVTQADWGFGPRVVIPMRGRRELGDTVQHLGRVVIADPDARRRSGRRAHAPDAVTVRSVLTRPLHSHTTNSAEPRARRENAWRAGEAPCPRLNGEPVAAIGPRPGPSSSGSRRGGGRDPVPAHGLRLWPRTSALLLPHVREVRGRGRRPQETAAAAHGQRLSRRTT